MKRHYSSLFVFVLFLGCVSYATKEDFKNLNSVVEVKAKKDFIYDKTIKWIAVSYNSPQKVMQFQDKAQGLITFNGACQYSNNPMYSFTLEYKIVINIKDNKFKIEMTPIGWIYSGQGQTGNQFYKEMLPTFSKEFEMIKNGIKEGIEGKASTDF